MAKEFARAFYKSKQWKTARQQALRRDHYTCHDCDARAEEVHHITELTPDNINNISIALGLNNLMCLCHNCHTKRTMGNVGDVPDGFLFDEMGMVVRRQASPPWSKNQMPGAKVPAVGPICN